jgi:hypothetical protein
MNEKIKSLVALMNQLDYKEFHAVLFTFPMEELEGMAIDLREAWKYPDDSPEHELLDDILKARKRRLNRKFVYSPDNKEKMLDLNRQIMECMEKLRKAKEDEVRSLEIRTKAKGETFLHAHEVEWKITPFIGIRDENGAMSEANEGIDGVLNDTLPEEHILSGSNPYFDREPSRNECDGLSHGELEDHYIGYWIHELYDHTLFSLFDIMRINFLRCELITQRQHFVEMDW